MIQNKRILHTLLKIFVSLIAFIIILKSVDIRQFLLVLQSANPYYFVLSLFSLVVSLTIGLFRWGTILKKYGQQKSIIETGKIYFLSFFYNVYVPGGIFGDVVRGYKTANVELSKTSSFTLVFIDRMFGMFGILAIGLLSFLAGIKQMPWNLAIISIITYSMLIILPYILFSRSFQKIITKNNKQKVLIVLHNSFTVLAEFFSDTKYMIYSWLYSILSGLTNILAFYFAGKAININLDFIVYLQLIPIVLIISFLPVSYKGLGLREAATVVLFGYQAISASSSLSFSIIYSINIFVLGLFSAGAFIFFKYFPIKKMILKT